MAVFSRRELSIRRHENGGVVLNQASHFLDILIYLLGEPLGVEGIMGNIRRKIPVEDAARTSIAFRNGGVAEFSCTTAPAEGHNQARLTHEGTQML